MNILTKNNLDKQNFSLFIRDLSQTLNSNLKHIIDLFNKSDNLVSWKTLFSLDKNWYPFFKQNADINGNILNNEKRLGVDKYYVNDIVVIQNNIREFDKNLDKCISFYQELKFIFYFHINK